MPTGRYQRGRDRKAKDAEVAEKSNPSNTAPPADKPDRPQTRAWTRSQQTTAGTKTSEGPSKQEHASAGAGTLQSIKVNIPTKPAPKVIHSPAASLHAGNSSERRPSKHRASGILAPDSRRVPQYQPLQNPELSSWLDTVQVVSPEAPRLPGTIDSPSVPDSRDEPENSMETSSSASGTSHILSDGVSTLRPVADTKNPQKAMLNKLRTRRAFPDLRTVDEKTEHFKSIFGFQKPFNIPFKDTKNLQAILTNFLQNCDKARPRDNSYTAIEYLSDEINKWKQTVKLTTITNRDFEHDVKHCQTSNEAVFQRTVMMSIIDRYQLNDMFDFNCEGHWSLQGTYPLPSTQGPKDKVTGPKPDLAIFFRLEALTGKQTTSPFAPVPPKLESCIWPDNYVRRCFPFVFLKAKKGFHDLTFAIYANMHSASQALYNIYQWMEKAGHTEIFFKDVRLFSIAMNAEKFMVRVHRASPIAGEEGLVFLYDELFDLFKYSRDDACLLIRNILVEYGVAKLHGILKSTFEEVSRQQKEGTFLSDEPPKRRIDPLPASSMKKARTLQASSHPAIDPSQSFGASRIDLSDDVDD